MCGNMRATQQVFGEERRKGKRKEFMHRCELICEVSQGDNDLDQGLLLPVAAATQTCPPTCPKSCTACSISQGLLPEGLPGAVCTRPEADP